MELLNVQVCDATKADSSTMAKDIKKLRHFTDGAFLNIQLFELPDPDSLLRSDIHFVSRLYIEGSIPAINIDDSAVGAVHAWRVSICEDQLSLGFRQGIVSPDLCPAKEESLCRCQAIDLFTFFKLGRFGKCIIGNA